MWDYIQHVMEDQSKWLAHVHTSKSVSGPHAAHSTASALLRIARDGSQAGTCKQGCAHERKGQLRALVLQRYVREVGGGGHAALAATGMQAVRIAAYLAV